MSIKTRLAQLEKQRPQPWQPSIVNYPPGYYERGIRTLREALDEMYNGALAKAEAIQRGEVLPEQPAPVGDRIYDRLMARIQKRIMEAGNEPLEQQS